MRIPILLLLVSVVLCILIDTYILRAIKTRLGKGKVLTVYSIASVLLYVLLIVAVAMPRRTGSEAVLASIMWMLFTFLSFYVAKVIFVIIDLIARIPRLFRRKRLAALSRAGIALAFITFGAIWWGALINRFNLQVRYANIYIKDLPAEFDGFRIAQISDLHLGTFGSDTTFVSRIVHEVNALKPDVIVFTGDIVNRHTAELRPHTSVLSQLKAPYGVYSILGNHDYGDYITWPSEREKADNLAELVRLQTHEMGWKLLLNDHTYLHRGNDSLLLVGVENIGKPPFKTYGNLSKALPEHKSHVTTVLLSHNPSHWIDSIAAHPALDIDLTLSGHTHAMQIELLGISPAALTCPTWGGLYGDADGQISRLVRKSDRAPHNLYVNIGLGTVGLPMRMGATPEITVLTLRKR